VVGLDLDLHYDTLRDATLAIRNGARFIATNLDPSYPMPDGQWPGAGAIVELVRVASGVDPIATGKPDVAMIDLIAERIGSHTDIWMIGDRPSTDLAMAKTAGWRSVLVLTGVVDSPADVPARWTPDLVIDSIADLPDELERLIGKPVDEAPTHH
jgi:4-nitrophenyl phosphatase